MPSLTLVLPPLTQLNTPYPSIGYLAQFLRSRGQPTTIRDAGIELFGMVMSREGLEEVFAALEELEELPEPAWRALALQDAYLRTVDPVISYLRGQDSGLAPLILTPQFLPRGPALEGVSRDAFGTMGTGDAARYLASRYLVDLCNLVSMVEPGFGMSQYHHHLSVGASSFDPIEARLRETTVVDRMLDGIASSLDTEVVGLSVPFPGNLYGALRMGGLLKKRGVHVVLGGGYVNTELREVDEPRLYEFVDSICYDDGEGPLLALLEHLDGGADTRHRTRTAGGTHDSAVPRVPFTPAPDYDGLDLSLYLQLIDTLNPAHRLWADGRWNKLTLAHGCYWRKCSFCDVNLDYIGHYENASASVIVDHMERLVAATGQRGFHFVDEAAPPKMLKAVALEILKRNLTVTFWGNIRFEKSYTPDLARLLAAAGLVAVTGGLEVANERLLKAIRKGVTVEQVVGAAKAFRDAGVMVHAYLMYGFPTQTDEETLDSMELVRQMFAEGVLQSAFWHRFVLTRHAPIFQEVESFGVELPPEAFHRSFASNDLPHLDPTGGDHDQFDAVLPQSLGAWMRGEELDRAVHTWFPSMAPTREPPDRIRRAMANEPREGRRLLWLGGECSPTEGGAIVDANAAQWFVACETDPAEWLCEVLAAAVPSEEPLLLRDAVEAFPGDFAGFAEGWAAVRRAGLVLI